jgi:PEP-CTERM motif
MTHTSFSVRLALALAAGLGLSTVSGHAQSASATISYTTAGANYDYTITLLNTGATDLNGFWYGWTYDGNNLPSVPTSLGNSLGWDNDPDGNSVEWENTYGTALAPGQSGTFTFVSSSSPTDLTTSPAGESVAYVYGIDGSQDYPGYSTDVFSPVLEVPEPSSVALLAAGVGIVGFALRRQILRRQPEKN